MIAGISTGYYKRLEQGVIRNVSDSVLDGLSRALQLDDAERSHLADLLRGTPRALRHVPQPRRRATIRPFVQHLLDSVTLPCCVLDDRLDLLAANDLGRAVYLPVFTSGVGPANHARYAFLDPGSRAFWADWDDDADLMVAYLRATAGHHPDDLVLADLIHALQRASPEFRARWARHEVSADLSGVKRIRHPLVGPLTLDAHAVVLPEEPRQRLLVHTVPDGSTAQEKLSVLARWTRRTSAQQLA